MFALIRWSFLCFLAVLAGVAAVSIPLGEKTVAERIGDLVSRAEVDALASKAAKEALVRLSEADGESPPQDELTDEDREALEALLDERAGGPGR